MSPDEMEVALRKLDLTQAEAARLLGVSTRTLRRWFVDSEIPGPAAEALLAWLELHERHLAWRADEEAIFLGDKAELASHLALAIEISHMIGRVEARGGPRLLWDVDLDKGRASVGPMYVGFYRLANGGFSLSTYRRSDAAGTDAVRDREFIEDAAYCIAQALGYQRSKTEREAARRLAKLGGTEPNLKPIPRRRPPEFRSDSDDA